MVSNGNLWKPLRYNAIRDFELRAPVVSCGCLSPKDVAMSVCRDGQAPFVVELSDISSGVDGESRV